MASYIGRRKFLATLGAVAAWPLAARAQQPKVPRIGIIDKAAFRDHLRQRLRDPSYIEGRNIAIEYRSTEGRPERLVAAATELAARPELERAGGAYGHKGNLMKWKEL